MKKIYSIVLMATALLIGANMQAATKVATWDALRTALQAGEQAELSGDIKFTYDGATFQSIWIGANAVDGDAPAPAVLDLAGHDIIITANSAVAVNAFVLSKGSLKITGTGTIEVAGATGAPAKGTNVISVFGADDANKVNPQENPFSHLFIDENVTIKTKNGSVIAIDRMTKTHASLAKTPLASKGYTTSDQAYGALVEVKGTLISEGADNTGSDTRKCYGIKANGNLAKPGDAVLEAYKKYVPYIHVFPSAVLKSDMRSDMAGSAAAYPSGYAQWLIEGTCDGASGVYISGGIINIHNATISSAASTYNEPESSGHANGSGSAVVVNSRYTYPGGVEVTISGDTKASATSGYAVEEIVNTTETKVDSIIIAGGSFEGGNKGALTISEKSATNAEVVVAGGNVTGAANIGNDELATYLNKEGDTHATIVTDPETGKTTLVISEGIAPTGSASVADQAGKSVKWTGAAETLNDDLNLKELEINEATAQTLTIAADKTLTVERVVLGANAQIVVNPGAKFIVTGEQGIVAPKASNIVLKNEEGKRSIFLFNPKVTSNRHPNATFEILSYSWRVSATEAQSEVFGIPTHNAVKSVACMDAGKYGYLQVYNDKGAWENIAFTDDTPFPYEKLNKPFAAYALTAYRAQNEDKLTFQFGGELVGNDDATLNANLKWSFFANSYTAEVDLAQFLAGLGVTAQYVDHSIYVSNLNGGGYWNWEAVDAEAVADKDAKITKLQPMQGFLLNNKGKVEANAINYKTMVYAPAVPGYAGAPSRNVVSYNNTAKMYVVVSNEAGAYDNVKLRETENTKSVEKYMNNDVNIYATADEKSAIFAAEDLANTYVGFSTVKGGKFTISFANVEGREFDLVDHATGARVAVMEGSTYEFTADANSANDYRFEIVERNYVPTAIENTEAVKSAKGIYTITGQYMGEMNVWNSLPAGVYVINGEKRVK